MAETSEQQKEAIKRIREATLGAPVVKTSTILNWNGVDIEVVKPTLAEARAIEENAIIGKGKHAKTDNIRKSVQILLTCARVPGTSIRPFTRHDIEAIEERGDDDFVGAILKTFGELTKDKDDKPEAIEKNCDGAQTV